MVRNRAKRVLRALLSARIASVPAGVDVVVRANADLPGTSTAAVAQDLDRQLAIVLRRVASQEGR